MTSLLSRSPVSGSRHGVLEDPDDEVDARDDGQDDVPEPEEDVNLLVQDVHAQHAEGVVQLNGARSSVLVEVTLGHLGKDVGHGVHALLGLHIGKFNDLIHQIVKE